MAQKQIELVANEGIFRGLSKQNMLFHNCIAELVDNGIAAKRKDTKFKIEIIISPDPQSADFLNLYIVDNGRGMSLETLGKALQLGQSATTENRLNEHGFGLKNALATLSGGNGPWKIWTKEFGADAVVSAEGPFKQHMTLNDADSFPNEEYLPQQDLSTVIKVKVRLTFLQSVQGRGAPAKDLATLRTWLIEHVGVFYRGYLEQDPETLEQAGAIIVCIGKDRQAVPPVIVPLGNRKTSYFEIEIGGQVRKLEYHCGTLDEVRRDKLVRGNKAKFYYQGNIQSQGIDIRLGRRTIATRQFETIWKTDDGQHQLTRHNRFNDFVGELVIPELPRGVLSTVNNKSDFNLDDPDWAKVFSTLNEIRPSEDVRQRTEEDLRKKWMDMIKATNPDDVISDEKAVWPTATLIDVYRRTTDGKELIYELKVGQAAPIHLYQLKMYWDGLVLTGSKPREATLLVEGYSTTIEEMANMMNLLTPPKDSLPYNFKLERHADKNLT